MYDTENPVPRNDGSQNRRTTAFKNIGIGLGGLGAGYGAVKVGLAAKQWGKVAPSVRTAAEDFGKSTPASIGRSIKSKGKSILTAAALKMHKAMHWKQMLNLQSRISAIELATLDYTRKYILGNPALASRGEPGYDPNVERVVKAAFLRKSPISEEEQVRRARERGRPIVSTTEVGGQVVGSHPGTEAGKKIRKPGQQTKPYAGIKSEISAQQRGLTARPKPIPVEELPAGENLPRQKGRIPKRGAGFEPSEKDVPKLWDVERAKTPEGDINYTYRNRFPPNLRPPLTPEEVRRNALKWRDPMAYHEARVKGEFTPSMIVERTKTDISGKARPSTGLPSKFLSPTQEATERAMAQSFRDKLAGQLRTVRRETIQPLRAIRRKGLGLPAVQPMSEGAMQRLRNRAVKVPDVPIIESGKPGPFAHNKPTIPIGGREYSPQTIHSIHEGQRGVIAKIQDHHVGLADRIKQGVQKRIEQNLTGAQLKESSNLMGDARRAVHTRYGEIKESAARITHEAFNPARVSIEGPFARIPKGMKNLPAAQLEDYEVKAMAEHAGTSTDWIRKQHQAFVHHTRLGTTTAGEEAIRKSMGSKIFGRINMPEEPIKPATSSLLRHLNKRTAIGAGIAAGLGLGAYGVHKWRNRKKELSARLREIRFAVKVKIPYSQAKGLVQEVRRRTMARPRFGEQSREFVKTKLGELDEHIKTYKQGEGLMSHLHSNLLINAKMLESAAQKVNPERLAEAKAAGYLEGSKQMEGVLNTQKQAWRQRLSGLEKRGKLTAIAAGAAGLGVGAGTGYALRRNGQNKETRFAVPGSALKKLRGKLHGKLGQELAIGTALTGGITAADAATSAVYPGRGQTRKQAAWEGAKRGAIYGSVLSGVEPLIRIPLSKRLSMSSKIKEIQFQKWATLRFEDPDIPSPWNKRKRLTVAQDRYRKIIREREIQRKESNIGKSALAGAALGGVLHRKIGLKLGPSLAVGAAAGLGTQAAALLHGRNTKDPYGEESIGSKRIERLPYQVGGLAAAGVAGHQIYKGARRAHLFKSNGQLIRFQFTPTEDKSKPWLEKEAKRWIEHPEGRVENAKKWIGRAGRIHKDINLPKDEKGRVVDERGRTRQAEWQKPWFKRTVYGGAAVAGLTGLAMAGRRIGRASLAAQELMHKGAQMGELSQGKQMAVNLTSGNVLRAIGTKFKSKFPVISAGTERFGKLGSEFSKTREELLKKGNKFTEGQVGQITGVKPRYNRNKDITGYDLINPAKAKENLQKIAAHEEKLGGEMERMRKLRTTIGKTQKARSVLEEMTKLSILLDNVIQLEEEEPGYVKVKPHYRKERRQQYPSEKKSNREGFLIGGAVGGTALAGAGGLWWRSRHPLSDKIAHDVEQSWEQILAARKAASHTTHGIPHFHLPTPK